MSLKRIPFVCRRGLMAWCVLGVWFAGAMLHAQDPDTLVYILGSNLGQFHPNTPLAQVMAPIDFYDNDSMAWLYYDGMLMDMALKDPRVGKPPAEDLAPRMKSFVTDWLPQHKDVLRPDRIAAMLGGQGVVVPPGTGKDASAAFRAMVAEVDSLPDDGGLTAQELADAYAFADMLGDIPDGAVPGPRPRPAADDGDVGLLYYVMYRTYRANVGRNQGLLQDARTASGGAAGLGGTTESGWAWRYGGQGAYSVATHEVVGDVLGRDAHMRNWAFELQAHGRRDRTAISIGVPYVRSEGSGALERYSYESIALNVLPQYYIFEQEQDPLDVILYGSVGVDHIWFDEMDEGIDDPTTIHYGGGVGAGRSWDWCDLYVTYLYERYHNIDGDDEITDDGKVGCHSVAAVCTIPFGERAFAQITGEYSHVPELPSELDSDEFSGGVSLGFREEDWGMSAGFSRTLNSSDIREWMAQLSFFKLW